MTGRSEVETGGAPKHEWVRHVLEQELAEGRFRPNRPLPPSRRLAERFEVSRTTIDTALQQLVARGQLVSRPRRGYFPVTVAAAVQPAGERTDAARVSWADHLVARPDPWAGRAPRLPDHRGYPYPFLPGQPEQGSFPVRAWLRAAARAFDGDQDGQATRDAGDGDDPGLRRAIVEEVLLPRGIAARPEEVLITNGAQQALALIARILIGAGTRVAMENPGYVDAARIFRNAGAEISLLPVGRQGVRLPERPDFSLLYLTPSHQHPTNVTMPMRRRRAVVEAAAANDLIVIEDDFDSEIRFRGEPQTPLRALDGTGRVIHVGTFSKILAPALRLGYVVADAELIEQLRHARYLSIKHPSGVEQRTLALFIASGDFARQVARQRAALRAKWEVATEILGSDFPWPDQVLPGGGAGLWLTGPAGYDTTALLDRARRRGVLFQPGEGFFLDAPAPTHHLRLGLSAIPLDRVRPGMQRLIEVI
ncbi:MAG: PLP-dependent aminotransferase family protein [Micropruina sp.]|uniref:MocR-like pyridoxine biosynthesis transcription factor PdxR n=1 Tax=Micropruina sp. TaxID=2737536 RepID=UPI0039E436A8